MLIGFSGKLASGKSTAAILLASTVLNYGLSAQVKSFATPVKEAAKIAGDLTLDSPTRYKRLNRFFTAHSVVDPRLIDKAITQMIIYGDIYPNQYGIKNRRLLQLVGTECGRDILGDTIWVDMALNDYSEDTIFVFDDVRFDNEANVLDVHIHIDETANLEEYMRRIETYAPGYVYSQHVSENGVSLNPDYTLPVGFSELQIDTIAEELCRQSYKLRMSKT